MLSDTCLFCSIVDLLDRQTHRLYPYDIGYLDEEIRAYLRCLKQHASFPAYDVRNSIKFTARHLFFLKRCQWLYYGCMIDLFIKASNQKKLRRLVVMRGGGSSWRPLCRTERNHFQGPKNRSKTNYLCFKTVEKAGFCLLQKIQFYSHFWVVLLSSAQFSSLLLILILIFCTSFYFEGSFGFG